MAAYSKADNLSLFRELIEKLSYCTFSAVWANLTIIEVNKISYNCINI